MGEQLEAAVPAPVPVASGTAVGYPRSGEWLRPGLVRVAGRLEQEAFLVVLFAIYLVGLTWNVPSQIASDTWMTFAYGREVVQHGLPSHDVLTVWAHGRTWTDQQWLGQLAFYGAYVAGGVRAAFALHAAALAASVGLALVVARRRGGSTRSVTWLALVSLVVVAWSSWTLRVQSLVFPLFVVLLWLLAADSRRPSRRVFLALPIVVLWANLHGTAFLLLPVALDGVLSSHWGNPRYRYLNLLLAAPAPFICAWIVGGALAHPATWYTRDYPPAAGDAVARIADADPQVRVFANERYADWLVLQHPELRGRIAFDGRFELLTANELEQIVAFRVRVIGSLRATRRYRLLVLDPVVEEKVVRTLLADPSRHVVYRDSHVVVISQPTSRSTS